MKQQLFILLRIIVSLALLGCLVALADFDSIFEALSHFNPVWLPAVFGFIIVSMLVSAWKWKILLNAQGEKKSLVQLFRIYITALFFNNFLPSSIGGDGIRIYLAGRESGKTATAASSVVLERVIAMVSLAMLGLCGALFARHPSVIAVILLGALLAAGCFISAVLVTGWHPGFLNRKEGKIWKAWKHFAESSGKLRRKPKALAGNLILSVLFQITVALVVGSIMAGLGLDVVPLPDLFYITSSSSVLAMLPVGMNGYGLREGGYVYLLQPFGYTVASALAVSFLFAIFVSIFSLAGGINWMLVRPVKKYSKQDEMAYE